MKRTRFILSAVAIVAGTLGALTTTALEKKDVLAVDITDVLGDCDFKGTCTGTGDFCTHGVSNNPAYILDGFCVTRADGTWSPM